MNGSAESPVSRTGEELGAGILALPNILSLSRVLLTPVFVVLMTQRKAWPAFIIFLVAGATDALDGFAARTLHKKTTLGVWLDPIGDKVLLTAAFVVLTVPALAQPNTLPLWLTALCIGRDVAIALSAMIIIALRGQQTFTPTLVGKISTICQVFLLYAILYLNAVGRSHPAVRWSYLAIALLVIVSWVQYGVRGIRILRRKSGPPSSEVPPRL